MEGVIACSESAAPPPFASRCHEIGFEASRTASKSACISSRFWRLCEVGRLDIAGRHILIATYLSGTCCDSCTAGICGLCVCVQWMAFWFAIGNADDLVTFDSDVFDFDDTDARR